jgi:hypothetical protein
MQDKSERIRTVRDQHVSNKGMGSSAGTAYSSGNKYLALPANPFVYGNHVPFINVVRLAAIQRTAGGTLLVIRLHLFQ